MRHLFFALLVLAATAGAKGVHRPVPVSDDGWDRGGGKGQAGSGSGNVGSGPTYSAGDERPSAAATANLIGMDQPGSPNEIAAQAAGYAQGGPCDQSAANQLQALTAQAIALANKAISIGNASLGCGTNQACYANYTNQLNAINAQLLPLKAEILRLAPLAQAEASCTGNSATSAQVQAPVPGVTLATVAKRFGVPLAGGTAGTGTAYQQLQTLAQQGQYADFDGRGAGMDKALGAYGNAAARAMQMGSSVEAGRELAGKDSDYSDPAKAAQEEYLKIDYSVLGSKYDKLADARAAAADDVASQAMASLAPPAPFPSDGPALIDASEAPDDDSLVDKATDSLFDGMKEGSDLSPQAKALDKILEISSAVGQERGLIGSLFDAANEMGSGSQSAEATNKLMGQLSQYNTKVEASLGESNPFKALLGADED